MARGLPLDLPIYLDSESAEARRGGGKLLDRHAQKCPQPLRNQLHGEKPFDPRNQTVSARGETPIWPWGKSPVIPQWTSQSPISSKMGGAPKTPKMESHWF